MFEESKYKELQQEFIAYKKSNESFINEAEQLKFLIENSEDMISIHDFDARYLYYFGHEKYDITSGDVIGKTPYDFFEKDIAEQIISYIKQSFQTGERIKKEIRFSWQGEKKWFEETVFPIKKNGNIVSVVKICKDINEKKEALLKLLEQKRFFQKVVNSFNYPLYVINAETFEIEFSNDYALRKDLSYGIKCYVFSNQTEKPCLKGNQFCPVNLLKYNDKPVVTEHVHTDKIGNKRHYEVHGFPIHDDKGKLVQVIEYNIEITDKKRAEQELKTAKLKAEESESLKSAFLANLSHEIRTPLNGILGFSELLKQKDLNGDKQSYYIDIINKSGNYLLDLINDIVDISKFDSGLMKLKESECNLSELLNEIFEMFNDIILKSDKEIDFLFENNCTLSNNIITDSMRLKQILINLIGNSIKFTNNGKIELQCRNNNNMLEFSVKDTGIGIEKDKLPYIFDRFRRAESTTQELYEGTGLGLAITKSCIELFKGKIKVTSEFGIGTEFNFSIPYKSV